MENLRFSWFSVIFYLFLTPFFLHAQSNTQNNQETRPVQLVWRGGEYALHYAVEIERLDNGTFRRYSRNTTRTLFYNVSLPPGEYRFRIIPYDVLNRPAEASSWMTFTIAPAQIPEAAPGAGAAEAAVEPEQPQIIRIENIGPQVSEEQKTEDNEQGTISNEQLPEISEGVSARFNTLGVSVGSAFIDPLVILTLHGSFSPLPFENLFVEIGCDFGFVSVYDDVESYYSVYPFLHLGYFIPFRERGGLFVGAGVGYMFGKYSFFNGINDVNVNVFGFDVTAGVLLFNSILVSYTCRTDFETASNKVAVGFVYRF